MLESVFSLSLSVSRSFIFNPTVEALQEKKEQLPPNQTRFAKNKFWTTFDLFFSFSVRFHCALPLLFVSPPSSSPHQIDSDTHHSDPSHTHTISTALTPFSLSLPLPSPFLFWDNDKTMTTRHNQRHRSNNLTQQMQATLPQHEIPSGAGFHAVNVAFGEKGLKKSYKQVDSWVASLGCRSETLPSHPLFLLQDLLKQMDNKDRSSHGIAQGHGDLAIKDDPEFDQERQSTEEYILEVDNHRAEFFSQPCIFYLTEADEQVLQEVEDRIVELQSRLLQEIGHIKTESLRWKRKKRHSTAAAKPQSSSSSTLVSKVEEEGMEKEEEEAAEAAKAVRPLKMKLLRTMRTLAEAVDSRRTFLLTID